MKITCESCSAQYDLDDSRIPPSGLSMKCPACLHTFTVRKSAAPPAPKLKVDEGIALSAMPAEGDDSAELPAPVQKGPRVEDLIDLPAPKGADPPKKRDVIDLPAPRGGTAKTPDVIDLPAPRAAKPPLPIPPPPTKAAKPPAPPPPKPELDDLPAPKVKRPEAVDLPAPRSGFAQPTFRDDASGLLAPKGASSSVGIGLDAPEVDDLLEPVRPSHAEDLYGPPPVDLEAMDTLAPKHDASLDLVTPKIDRSIDLLEPKPEVMEVTPQTMDMVPVDKAPLRKLTDPVAPTAEASKRPAFVADEYEAKPRGRLSRGLLLAVGALVLIGALGVSLGLFTSSGFFGVNLITGKHAEIEAKLTAARKSLAEDTLAGYRKVATELQPLAEADPKDAPLVAMAAQARLCVARLGLPSEIKAADKLLGPLDADEKAGSLPDVQKARALKLLVAGKSADARTKLTQVLQAAPADAAALVYLGWTELSVGDWAAAEHAFAKALAAESNRAAALYGLGFAKERQGDLAGAAESYAKVLARSPNHFGALVGAARVAARRGASEGEPGDRRIADLIDKRSAAASPRELADAWASLGVIASESGRREEAEDRLKRALGLDADSALARETLSRVQCDLGRAAEAVPPLHKLVLAQPKNLDARLILVRALLEGRTDNYAADAQSTLAPAVVAAPKDARVLYWQGQLMLGGEKLDRDGALAKFKAAVEADPKLMPAYLAESALLNQLGRGEDALDVLKQAASRASDEAQLMTELGVAYLGLGKPIDAEAQLRAALDKRPDLHEARMFLGAALEAQGRLDDAGRAYDAVAEKAPKFPGLLERQGRLAVKQGKKDQAWNLFQQALGEGVPTQSLRLAVADLAIDLGNLDDAQKMAEIVIKEDDRSAVAHLLMARVQLQRGKPEDALPEARRAAMLSDSPEAHLALGRALEGLSKLDQAVAEYQLARASAEKTKAAGAQAEATLGRARIMVRMGATKDALTELAGLVKDGKLRAQALLLMGDCYSDLQQGDKARHAYEDAVKFGPQMGDAAFKYGRSLHDAGRKRPAMDMLERAVKLGGDKAPYAAEAYLLLGDTHRESHESDAAVRAYKKFLELAPSDSPERAEVQKHISILGGG